MVAAPRVVSTASRVLYEVLGSVFTSLGFDAVGDRVFRDLVIARVVESTSIRDTARVLIDLGREPASEKTMRRTLTRAHTGGYRDQNARLCFRPRHGQRRCQPVLVRRDHVVLRGRQGGRPA